MAVSGPPADPGAGAGASRRSFPDGHVLAVAVQKGRLFQQHHPDVTVLRDRGRFLLVSLPPGHPALAGCGDEPCYAVYPAAPGTEVFRDLDGGGPAAQRTAGAAAVLDRLSMVEFRVLLDGLTALKTRLSTSAFYRQAAQMCVARFSALGYRTVLDPFDMAGGPSCNVLALPPGGEPPAVLAVAHLDSVNHQDGAGAAPGADDNASGSAGVVTMAGALAGLWDRLPVGFILFGGEEQGLLGSRHWLSTLPAEARGILRAVVNMDMIGSLNPAAAGAPPRYGVLLEGGSVSQAMIDGLAAQAAAWTDLAVQTSLNPFASDHVPFIEAGIPAVLTIEGADGANSHIHGPDDTPDRIDHGLAHRILRMNTAYIASLAGI